MKKIIVLLLFSLILLSVPAPARADFSFNPGDIVEPIKRAILDTADEIINKLVTEIVQPIEDAILHTVEPIMTRLEQLVAKLITPALDILNEYNLVKKQFLHWGPFGTARNAMNVWRRLSTGHIGSDVGVVFRMPSNIPHPSPDAPVGYSGGTVPTGQWSGGWVDPNGNSGGDGSGGASGGWGNTSGWDNGGNTDPSPSPSPSPLPTPTPYPTPSPTPTPTPTPSPTPAPSLVFNDEFSGSISGYWSGMNLPGRYNQNYSSCTVDTTTVSGNLRFNWVNDLPNTNYEIVPVLRGYYYNWQGAENGDLTMVARCKTYITQNRAYTPTAKSQGGVFLSDKNTDYYYGDDVKITTYGFVNGNDNTPFVQEESWSRWYILDGSWGPGDHLNANSGYVWYRMTRENGDWYASYSLDGHNWLGRVFFRQPGSGGAWVGICCESDADGTTETLFDFFRIYRGIVNDVPINVNGDAPSSSAIASRSIPSSASVPVSRPVFRSITPSSSGTAVARPASSSVGLGDYTDSGGIVLDFRPYDASTGTGTIFGTVRVMVRGILVGLCWMALLFWVFRTLTVKIQA